MGPGGSITDKLYKLDPNNLKWAPAPVEGGGAPPLYRHSAVPYTVGGSPRVLLCGGVNAKTNESVPNVYELSYNASSEEYVFTEMAPLPDGLVGHSLVARGDATVYLSGGMSGGFEALPSAALPPQLAAIMDRSQTGGAPQQQSLSTLPLASARVYQFSRNEKAQAAERDGVWRVLGSAARPVAFHASWLAGSSLYLYGGVQGRADANSTAQYGLQVVQLPSNVTAPESPARSLYNSTAVNGTHSLWGAVQPGSLSGAAVWVNRSATTPSEARVWIFGGWRTPQPLPTRADAYLSPQDSGLTWRLVGGGSDSWVSARWLAPLQGDMAPRAAAGLMAVPVAVGGSRKLLLLGGRSPRGWTGASATNGPSLVYPEAALTALPMPAGNSPLDSAKSYQLYDIWLVDTATGEREAVWSFNGSAGPFGDPDEPAAVGRLWDRRLLEYQAAGSNAGSSGTALYLQAEEMVSAAGSTFASLKPGIWRLTLSRSNLTAADGEFAAITATWQPLLPAAGATAASAAACYPRALYGAAHLVSNGSASSTTSYIALHGGLTLQAVAGTVFVNVSDSVCLLEMRPDGTSWLRQPTFGYAVPQARYRHACASRPGLAAYSMTCYGGLGGDGSKVLADAFTLTLPPGVSYGSGQFVGTYAVAPANYSAPRPGPRVDHWMVPLRGGSGYSAVLLVGGSRSATTAAVGYAAGKPPLPPPRQAVWLLEAAACDDPDVPTLANGAVNATAAALAGVAQSGPDRKAQVWLSVLPKRMLGDLMAGNQTLAAAGLVRGESGDTELWLLLAEGGERQVGDVRALRAVATAGGCLSGSVQPSCNSLSYTYDTVVNASCWSGAMAPKPSLSGTLHGDSQTTSLFLSYGGFSVLDPDGAGVHFRGSSRGFNNDYSLSDIQLPLGLGYHDITVIAYGKPYIELGSTRESLNWILALPPSYNISVKVRLANGTALPRALTEIRVRAGDGIARRRRPVPMQFRTDPDARSTDSTGTAEYLVMNSSTVQQPDDVLSYMVTVTPPNSKSYLVPLQSPEAASKGSAAQLGSDDIRSSLLAGSDVVYNYNITIRLPPDNLTDVEFRIVFQSPNGTQKHLPTSRRWMALLFLQRPGGFVEAKGGFNGTYGKTKTSMGMDPGTYFLEMYDTDTRQALKQSPDDFTVPNATAAAAGTVNRTTIVVPVVVPLSSVGLSVSFAGLLSPPASGLSPGFPKPLHVLIRLTTIVNNASAAAGAGSGGGGGGGGGAMVEALWDDQPVENGAWEVLPGVLYRAVFHFTSVSNPAYHPLYAANFTAPPLQPDGSGGYAPIVVTLPQMLLCGGLGNGSGQTPGQVVSLPVAKGRLPAGAAGPVAYPGSPFTCEWRIATGMPSLTININYSGLSLSDKLNVISDLGRIALPPTGGAYSIQDLVSNVTVQFSASNDGVLDYFVLEWAGQPQGTSMPPQFIMMIAASSAAAGAMLLFLCLWHCVFRPVQLRRQQAAAAMAAAASAAANAAGAAPGGRGASRNRVPRRYLRMMTTSLYSVKDAAGAATPRLAAPSTSSPLRSDSVKPGDAAGVGAVAATVAQPQPGEIGGNVVAAVPAVRPLERSSSAAAAPSKAESAVAATAPASSATAAGMTAGPGPASSSSDPASHGQSDPGATGGEVCAICLCEFEEGERIKHLPCKHFYHVTCIDQWLGRDITCPLCKDNVLEALQHMFGPLPPKGPRQGGGRTAEATDAAPTEAIGAATAAGEPPGTVPGSGDDAAASGGARASGGGATATPAAAAAGSGGGGAVVSGVGGGNMDLEMVVILPHEAAAAATGAAESGGRAASSGSTLDAASLGPQSAGVAAAAPSPAAGSAGGAPAPIVLVVSAAGSPRGGGGGAGNGANAAGVISASNSRELRPMRRNISADLTAEQDGTSSDSDSADSEYDVGPRRGRQGSRTGVSAAATAVPAAASTARAFQVLPQPSVEADESAPLPHASVNGWAAPDGGGDMGGNQLAFTLPPLATVAASTAAAPAYGGVAASSYYETGGLAPSPRPVAEHVQRSPCSSTSSTAMRWISGTSQVAPFPRPMVPLALAGGPTVHRLARAQEAQMSAAAAALSAAAAGISNGAVGGGNSWRTTSSTSISGGGAGPAFPPYNDGGAAAAVAATATATGLSYRVHHNPLAQGSGGSRTDVGSPRAAHAAALTAAATDFPSGSLSPVAASAAAAGASPPRQALAGAGASATNAVSVVFGDIATGQGGHSRPGSANSASHQHRAVPAVSASCEDMLRLLPASPQQPQQQVVRTTVTGLGSGPSSSSVAGGCGGGGGWGSRGAAHS